MDNWAKAYDQGTYINHPNYHSPTNDQNKYTDTNYEHKKIITQVNTNIILDREVHKLRSLIPEKFLAGNYRIHILRSATNYIKHLEQETYIDPFQAPYHHLNHNDDTNEQNKNTTRGLGEKYKITYTDQSTMITDRKFIMDDAFDELNCAIKHPALIHLTRIEIVKQAITYINFLKTDTSYDPFQIPCQSPDKPSDQPPPPYPSHFLEQPSIFPLDIISDFQECQNQNQSTSNNPPSFKEQSLSQDYLTTNNSFLPKDYGIQQNTPAALGITLNITPRNQQDNKEYFHNNIIDQSDNNEETSDSSINDHTGFCIDTLHNSEDSSPEQQNTSVDTDTDTDTADEGQKTSSTIIDQITELENNLDESDKQGYFCLQNLPSPVQENSSQHQQLEKTISPSENMTVSEPTSKKSKEHIQENAKKVYDLKLLELHKVRSLLYKIGSSNTHPPDKNLLTKSETLLLSAEIFKIYADHEKTEDPEIKETIREHLNRTTKKGHGNKKRRTTERKRNDLIAEYKILKKIFKDNSLSQKQVLTNTITKIKEIFPDTTEKPNIVASSDNLTESQQNSDPMTYTNQHTFKSQPKTKNHVRINKRPNIPEPFEKEGDKTTTCIKKRRPNSSAISEAHPPPPYIYSSFTELLSSPFDDAYQSSNSYFTDEIALTSDQFTETLLSPTVSFFPDHESIGLPLTSEKEIPSLTEAELATLAAATLAASWENKEIPVKPIHTFNKIHPELAYNLLRARLKSEKSSAADIYHEVISTNGKLTGRKPSLHTISKFFRQYKKIQPFNKKPDPEFCTEIFCGDCQSIKAIEHPCINPEITNQNTVINPETRLYIPCIRKQTSDDDSVYSDNENTGKAQKRSHSSSCNDALPTGKFSRKENSIISCNSEQSTTEKTHRYFTIFPRTKNTDIINPNNKHTKEHGLYIKTWRKKKADLYQQIRESLPKKKTRNKHPTNINTLLEVYNLYSDTHLSSSKLNKTSNLYHAKPGDPQATKIILNDTSINKEKKLNNLLIIVKRQLGIDEKLNSIQSLKIIIEKLEMRHYNPVESLQCVK